MLLAAGLQLLRNLFLGALVRQKKNGCGERKLVGKRVRRRLCCLLAVLWHAHLLLHAALVNVLALLRQHELRQLLHIVTAEEEKSQSGNRLCL